MRKLIICLIAVGTFCGSLQASTDMEQDMDVIVKTILGVQKNEMTDQLLTILATQAVDNGDKTMVVEELVAKFKSLQDSFEFYSKFYPFFLETFTPDEVKHLRTIYEDETYLKMLSKSTHFQMLYFATMTESMENILRDFGEDKPKVVEGESKVVEVTVDNFEKEVEQANGFVIVDFYANWCGPCKKMKPIFDDLSCEFSNIKFVKIDCDQAREIAKRYKVTGLPSFLFFKNGENVGRVVGFTGKEAFDAKIVEIFG